MAWVPLAENNTQGNTLIDFYRQSRVMTGDGFYCNPRRIQDRRGRMQWKNDTDESECHHFSSISVVVKAGTSKAPSSGPRRAS
ncbi:hypothetical protein [Rhodococcus wratislaviensis]|uniref:hypothetical protein n=1 Tax=Rhodococcus wratislaviensis TaxID=44752 RepID=UPI0037C69038